MFTYNFFFSWPDIPSGSGPSHYRGFTITLRHTTLGRTSLDQWSSRRRDLYLTTNNTHKRQTLMPRRDSNLTLANERPQSHTLYRAASEIGLYLLATVNNGNTKCTFLISITYCAFDMSSWLYSGYYYHRHSLTRYHITNQGIGCWGEYLGLRGKR
jgi:hypothetical protein